MYILLAMGEGGQEGGGGLEMIMKVCDAPVGAMGVVALQPPSYLRHCRISSGGPGAFLGSAHSKGLYIVRRVLV